MNPLTFVELLLSREFLAGLGWGIVGLVILIAAPRARTPSPIWGLVATAAALAASATVAGRRLSLAVAVIVVAVGGELTRRNRLVGLSVVGLGAVVVALRSGIEAVWWYRLGTVLFIMTAGWLMSRADEAMGASGIPALMVGGTAVGVWATIPDTEIARIVIGSMAATVVAAWPLRRTRIGNGGAYAIAAVLAWAVAIGGVGRLGSIIGGWATIGAFSIAVTNQVERMAPWKLVVLHAGSVLVASRIAGLQESPYIALAIAAPALLATVLIGHFVVTEEQRAERH